MIQFLPLSIGIGLTLSLIFAELFAFAPGGMIVPGYFALYLDHPITCATTIGLAVLTFLAVRALTPFVILYGKRRTVLMILVGYCMGAFARSILPNLFPGLSEEMAVIGF